MEIVCGIRRIQGRNTWQTGIRYILSFSMFHLFAAGEIEIYCVFYTYSIPICEGKKEMEKIHRRRKKEKGKIKHPHVNLFKNKIFSVGGKKLPKLGNQIKC